MIGIVPRGLLEFLLFFVMVGALVLVVRGVRQRRAFQPISTLTDEYLPTLSTNQRVSVTVRRVFRDPVQNVWLVEASLDAAKGRRKLTFCAADYAANHEIWESTVGKKADVAVYALSTLAPGGVEAMRDQIKDLDRVTITPDLVRLVPAGQFANDYAVIGRVLSHREETMKGDPLVLYRAQVIREADITLVLELAVEADDTTPFAENTMVHGSARLFGYLETTG